MTSRLSIALDTSASRAHPVGRLRHAERVRCASGTAAVGIRCTFSRAPCEAHHATAREHPRRSRPLRRALRRQRGPPTCWAMAITAGRGPFLLLEEVIKPVAEPPPDDPDQEPERLQNDPDLPVQLCVGPAHDALAHCGNRILSAGRPEGRPAYSPAGSGPGADLRSKQARRKLAPTPRRGHATRHDGTRNPRLYEIALRPYTHVRDGRPAVRHGASRTALSGFGFRMCRWLVVPGRVGGSPRGRAGRGFRRG